jgi:hypothetical protein
VESARERIRHLNVAIPERGGAWRTDEGHRPEWARAVPSADFAAAVDASVRRLHLHSPVARRLRGSPEHPGRIGCDGAMSLEVVWGGGCVSRVAIGRVRRGPHRMGASVGWMMSNDR